jgi:hypothetical protein
MWSSKSSGGLPGGQAGISMVGRTYDLPPWAAAAASRTRASASVPAPPHGRPRVDDGRVHQVAGPTQAENAGREGGAGCGAARRRIRRCARTQKLRACEPCHRQQAGQQPRQRPPSHQAGQCTNTNSPTGHDIMARLRTMAATLLAAFVSVAGEWRGLGEVRGWCQLQRDGPSSAAPRR